VSHTPAGAAFTTLVLEVFRLNGALLDAGDALTRPVGQSSARWQVMGCIDESALSVAQIARVMGLARQSVQRVANLLVADGLAEFTDNPVHKRAKLLHLTKTGLATLERIETAQRRWANELGGQIGLSELEMVNVALARVLKVLESG
jgi:DNA-binding MarR family transcriptional regulator